MTFRLKWRRRHQSAVVLQMVNGMLVPPPCVCTVNAVGSMQVNGRRRISIVGVTASMAAGMFLMRTQLPCSGLQRF